MPKPNFDKLINREKQKSPVNAPPIPFSFEYEVQLLKPQKIIDIAQISNLLMDVHFFACFGLIISIFKSLRDRAK